MLIDAVEQRLSIPKQKHFNDVEELCCLLEAGSMYILDIMHREHTIKAVSINLERFTCSSLHV